MAVWKEQGVTIQVPGEDLVLEGVWQAGSERGAVIAPPHPEYGGSLANPVVNEIAYGLHKLDIPSLRFNWRGVGGSQGQMTSDAAAAIADYRAALEHLADTVSGRLIGCGYSFGAATALRVAVDDERIERLILVAPPLGMIEQTRLEELERPVLVIVGGRDEFAPAAALSERLGPLANARLEVIAGVDHFFMSSGLAHVAEFVASAVGES